MTKTGIHVEKGILVETLKVDVYLAQLLDLAIIRLDVSPEI